MKHVWLFYANRSKNNSKSLGVLKLEKSSLDITIHIKAKDGQDLDVQVFIHFKAEDPNTLVSEHVQKSIKSALEKHLDQLLSQGTSKLGSQQPPYESSQFLLDTLNMELYEEQININKMSIVSIESSTSVIESRLRMS